MSYARIDRISQEVKRELSLLIPMLKDPRIPSMVSVTNASVSRDFSYAEVSVSVFGTLEQQQDAIKGLESSKGFLRRELAKKVQLRITPELIFKLDHSISEGARICDLISSVQRNEET